MPLSVNNSFQTTAINTTIFTGGSFSIMVTWWENNIAFYREYSLDSKHIIVNLILKLNHVARTRTKYNLKKNILKIV